MTLFMPFKIFFTMFFLPAIRKLLKNTTEKPAISGLPSTHRSLNVFNNNKSNNNDRHFVLTVCQALF